MEDLAIRLKKITSTNNYRFKTNLIKEILEEFKIQMSKKESFEQAIKIDENHHPVHVNYDKIMQIIDDFLKIENYNIKFTPSNIIDGYGNIAVSYNGDPYLTLKLLLMSIRTHNNIVFFTKRYYAVNTKIVETLNMIASKKSYASKIASVEYEIIDNVFPRVGRFFNFLVYIGDKRSYYPLRKKLMFPSIYSGYGNIDVFVEDRSFKDLLLNINQYEKSNEVNINYYDNTLAEETLMFINKYELTDCFVLLSKNTELIYKLISEVKAKNIYINSFPFENYKLEISEKDLIYSKNIIMN